MDLRIERLVYGGSGLARTDDGKVVLVPFSLPGEVIEVESITPGNNIYTSFPSAIKDAHPSRIIPPCPYFMECGGCHYQHASYDLQLTQKKTIVVEQLERIGEMPHPTVANAAASDHPFNYRNHVQLHLNEEGKPGFQRARSHDVIPVDHCLLLEEPLNLLLRSLTFEKSTGIQRIAMRDDGIGLPLLFMSGETANPPEFEVDFPLNVVYRGPAGDIILSGAGHNTFEILGNTFKVSAGSFFQTNRSIAEKIVKLILQEISLHEPETILDCYCGVGFFSKFFVKNTEKLVGIESSEDACNDFAENLDEFNHVELYQGNVEDVLPSMNIHPDLAIVDPPRAGMASGAMQALIKAHPREIIYISCDPSTLARDIKLLRKSGYRVNSINPFDMFPQTYHVETVAIMSVGTS